MAGQPDAEQLPLLKELRGILDTEQSVFRAQLLREDIARIEKLLALAIQHPDLLSFQKAGKMIGWTANDMMTHRVAEPLDALIVAVHAYQTKGPTQERSGDIRKAWIGFCQERNEKLIKCL